MLELHENTHLQLLENISEYANSLIQNQNNKNSKNSKKYLEKINQLYTFNRALDSAMKYLD